MRATALAPMDLSQSLLTIPYSEMLEREKYH
jgi:hypothetical protein